MGWGERQSDGRTSKKTQVQILRTHINDSHGGCAWNWKAGEARTKPHEVGSTGDRVDF